MLRLFLPPILVLSLLVAKTSGLSSEATQIETFDKLVDGFLPLILGQKASNSEGPRVKYRDEVLNDNKNDDVAEGTPQELLIRAGFNFENYYVQSSDGYITQLIRIINPFVDRLDLRKPPIMFIHGGVIDPTSFIWASNLQHHPEPWPRSSHNGLFSSSNRSMPLMLANNGYDVWLAGVRGSNRENQGHVKYRYNETSEDLQLLALDKTSQKYWRFSFNEIVDLELPKQMDKIMSVTESKNISVLGLSLGSMSTLALFSSNKQYARKVHTYISMLPIINNVGTNNFVSAVHQICRILPNGIGISLFTQLLTTKPVRQLMITLSKIKSVRYTLIWLFYTSLFGPSPTYQTFMELPVVGHVLMPTGFLMAKHYCQQVVAGQLQRFDFGGTKNLKFYGTVHPPRFDLANFGVKNWAVISGGQDKLATTASVKQVINQAGTKPQLHIHVPHYNHIDSVAAVDNDIFVNLRVLQYLNKFH